MNRLRYFALGALLFVAGGVLIFSIKDTQPNPFTIWVLAVGLIATFISVLSILRGVDQ